MQHKKHETVDKVQVLCVTNYTATITYKSLKTTEVKNTKWKMIEKEDCNYTDQV